MSEVEFSYQELDRMKSECAGHHACCPLCQAGADCPEYDERCSEIAWYVGG